MALEELLQTLKENERQQIDDIWQAAKEEAEAMQREVDKAVAEFAEKYETRLAGACQESKRAIISGSRLKAREKILYAYQALDEDLQRTARELLPRLRDDDYETVFADLAAELPQYPWQKIFVNPADTVLAAKLFPADSIQPDPLIIGGLIAATAEDRVVVDNTFAKRLERDWPKMMPAVIAAIRNLYDKSGHAENSARV